MMDNQDYLKHIKLNFNLTFIGPYIILIVE